MSLYILLTAGLEIIISFYIHLHLLSARIFPIKCVEGPSEIMRAWLPLLRHYMLLTYTCPVELYIPSCFDVSRQPDGRYGVDKYFKLYYVLLSYYNENWLALSTNTVLATKFPTDFNSTLFCFSKNSSKLCCIDTTVS